MSARREHFVYWMFDESDRCLYVGVTRHPEQRWRQHQTARPHMTDRVHYRKMAGPYAAGAARRIEKLQQNRLQPTYDRRIEATRRAALSLVPGLKPTKASTYGVWQKLRVLRERSGLKAKELSQTSGISTSYLSQLESGDRWPNATVTKKLAAALNVPYTVLERPASEKEGVAS